MRGCHQNGRQVSLLARLTVGAGLALWAAVGGVGKASAQCSNYLVTQGTGNIIPGEEDTGNHIDDGTTLISLPFSWSLYGVSYDSAYVCSNGNLQFVSTGTFPQAYTNDCLPSTSQVTGATIFPHWDDLRTDTTFPGAGVWVSTNGTAPNRNFAIEWRAVYFANTAQTANFEVVLYEGQTRFDVIYGQVDGAGVSATVGVQAGSAGPFTQFECSSGGISQGMMLTFDCPTTYPPSCSLSTDLSSASPGGTFNAFANVLLGGGPPSTGLTCSLDATSIDGGTVALHDDGVAPDVTAGDHIFSGAVTVGANATTGPHTLTNTVNDAEGRNSTCTAFFTVLPAGCTGENEPCGVNNPDTVNGGCNSTPPVYSTAMFDTDYCGSCANSTSFRDTDWWTFTIPPTANAVVVTASAQFLAQSFILAPTCPAVILSPAHLNSAGNTDLSYSYGPLTPGDYIFFMSPQGFDGSAVCGVNDSYTFRLTAVQTGACCTSDGCAVMNNLDCAAAGGHFQGMGSNCGDASYNFSNSENAFVDISTTGTLEPVTSACDDCTADVSLPFGFNFYGVTYNDVWISSNGNLQFGAAPNAAYVNDTPPSAATPNNAIYPLWDDLYFDTGGIYYQTDGTAPNRTFTVAWINRSQFAQAGTSETFEAILYEGSNNIEFRYGNIDADAGGGGPGGSDYTVGVENADGTAASTITGFDLGTGNTARMLTFVPGVDPCAGPHCGSADFDCNGDVGTDADILSFFACLAGNCPAAPCTSTADFDGDGSVGTDADITAFFRVLGGGNC